MFEFFKKKKRIGEFEDVIPSKIIKSELYVEISNSKYNVILSRSIDKFSQKKEINWMNFYIWFMMREQSDKYVFRFDDGIKMIYRKNIVGFSISEFEKQ